MRSGLPRGLRGPQGVVTVLGALALLLVIVLAPYVWGDAATATSVADRVQGPSAAHPFGTDDLGRDVLARVLIAARLSVLLALGATAVAVSGGIVLGVVATVLPRPLRRLVSAFIDILLSFPWLLLALFFSVIWGATASGAMLAVGFAGVPSIARLTYTLASSVTGRDFVRAARIVGVGPAGVVVRHVIPNIAPPMLVNTAAYASTALLSFAGLSFLGLGVQAPGFDWGRLLREGIARIYVNPMAALGPGIAIVLTGLILNAIGSLTGESASKTPLRPRASKARARAGAGDPEALVEVEDLRVSFPDRQGQLIERVRGVSLTIRPGETVGIVGASGSGKSVTAMAVAGLLGPEAAIDATRLSFQGIDMTAAPRAADRRRLGLELAVVFQDPLTSLNPSLTVGRQLTEVSRTHDGVPRAAARRRAREVLASVGIARPERRARQYPHELSGGMRQRAMIGMGLMGRPRLVIADEPTTALDVTVQRQVLRVLRDARRRTGSAILFISHDIALVSGFCDRVLVMKDGQIVEEVAAARLDEARHPYTRALVACVPHMGTDRTRPLPVIDESGGVAEEARA
ncbi:dipeptide/oligopeptide/nickel ABC transporter permease/ATP-binding protein [Nonomuraea fuscirosea]|uniref:dipeptide/oligopeptide/nickel ABC transporter permease/ATP-binding protein n=1 Tax=Nonomuraea fuscirosea TaxID=1291556 RepID=UPI002DDAAF44|nr:dipeptide/oligopeptide/nickel ABC transporter permease/ATP-binding protein [Nonomuraea fuscirosea]WSA48700.1 dipeptide/oligopeptide/nickel ABC transporter permease/ATP-binding protein [Nonomuraea fuscirosea]